MAVLVGFTVLMVVVLGSLAYLSASTKYSRAEQDTDLALTAARSGLNDLLLRLRTDPAYLDDVASKKDEEGNYCLAKGAGGPASEGDKFRDACGWTWNEPQWESYGNGPGGEFQRFHYVIKNYSELAKSLEVVSTGASGSTVRSLKARLAVDSTPMYLYISDYEVVDPTDYTTYPNGKTSGACGAGWVYGNPASDLGHAWQIKDGSTDPEKTKPARKYLDTNGILHDCAEPFFAGWDTLNGPVHSNDTIKSKGATFTGDFTTADPKCSQAVAGDPSTWNSCVNGGAIFSKAPSHSGLKAIPKVPDSMPVEGCRYQGPTRIIFDGDKMRVWSKDSVFEPANGCGTLADLASSAGAEATVPDGSVIYVENSQTKEALDNDKDADPRTADRALPSDWNGHLTRAIPARGIGGTTNRELPLGTYSVTDMGNPTTATQSYRIEINMEQEKKRAAYGNLWLEGEVDASVTVYSEASIVITGDLLVQDYADDLLGLMAKNSVEIYNPVLRTYRATSDFYGGYMWQNPTDASKPVTGWPTNHASSAVSELTIEAAMIADNGSFRLQNWKIGGDLGTLEVKGSIAQNFRGVLAWQDSSGSIISGYRKSFIYNENLSKKEPVKFPPLSNGVWSIWYQEKVDPAPEVKK
ncbi:MAG: hypothetical protein LBK95_13020 [Bifidobacteriaceae bacterium]|nr:hypothetical protein [Bifidobacteriaceae bacterium]